MALLSYYVMSVIYTYAGNIKIAFTLIFTCLYSYATACAKVLSVCACVRACVRVCVCVQDGVYLVRIALLVMLFVVFKMVCVLSGSQFL